ncbi:MAG: hypothetical protein LCH61_17250 [Proteobacteria bacterium]|nr:hypothetical protein [Pseudomonadota bacterium]
MKIARYEFAEGARFQAGSDRTNPNAVGEHLELLRKREHGELTPEDVVADARNPNSPLHQFFEWDDSEAAQQHRLGQARGLIRAVVAIYVSEDKPAVRTKAFIHISEPGAPHYREASHALSMQKTRDMVLQRAWGELMQWKRRYQDLAEFAELVPVIKQIGAKIVSSRKG